MRVGWLTDQHDWSGGAELTMAEFRAAAPEDVEIIDCPPGDVKPGMDRYVIGNCVQALPRDLNAMAGAPRIRYLNDVWPHGDPAVRENILQGDTRLIFCSPLHRERFPYEHKDEGVLIPPPLDLANFRKHSGHKPKDTRKGTCWMGMAFYGKGIQQAVEWAHENGPVDFYGGGPMMPPPSPAVNLMGPLTYEKVAPTLARYERFLFLPTQMEPFGRSVVEAWAAGCELVTNRNVGALHWIENEPEKLKTAAKDFWAVVLA